jgi:hypothetical protein
MSFLAQGGRTEQEHEEVEKAMQSRERKYGYKRGSNASYKKPAEYEGLSESQFADPVGYNYPIDEKHVRGAVTYWQHLDHRKAYGDPKARMFITEKIVRAALKFGVEITYDPKDPEYRTLPEDLKRRMKGYSEKKSMLEDWQTFRAWQETLYKAQGKRIPVF